ncbi:MAG: hypothetical protein J6C82_04980 [Clostridia bacterium]|nr:hypothetical protein [Clostridia bacterium]
MANEKNLKPIKTLSKEEAKKRGSKGGKKSVESRRKKKQLKECMITLLDLDIKDPDLITTFKSMGIEDKSNKMLVTLGLFNAAASGDVKAFKEIKELIGENIEDDMSKLDEVLGKIEGNI